MMMGKRRRDGETRAREIKERRKGCENKMKESGGWRREREEGERKRAMTSPVSWAMKDTCLSAALHHDLVTSLTFSGALRFSGFCQQRVDRFKMAVAAM